MKKAIVLSLCMSSMLAGCAATSSITSDQKPEDSKVQKTDVVAYETEAVTPQSGSSIYATTSISKPVRDLPANLEGLEVSVYQSTAVPFDVFVQKVADSVNTPIQIEERPSRDGVQAELPAPSMINGPWVGKLRLVLNQLSEVSGYSWEFDADTSQIRFYRFHDQETLVKMSAEKPNPSEQVWWVRPNRTPSLKAVLESWAKQAGWEVTWPTDVPDYKIKQEASYTGTFQEAAGQLLFASMDQSQPIAPIAYTRNRQIEVVKQK